MNEIAQPSLFDRLLEIESKPSLMLDADEIYALADAEIIKQLKEDRTIERKPSGVNVQTVGDYLCMWANTAPYGGLLAVGIEDNGELSGCISSDIRHLNELESAGMQHCPEAMYESKRVWFNSNGGKNFIILFRVRYNDRKVIRNNKGEVFTRLGDRKRRLVEDQIRELANDKGEVSFEQEPSTFNYPDDFNLDAIRDFADAFRKARDAPALTDTDVLEVRRLGQRKGATFTPNNACVILFAKDPYKAFPGCRIRFFRFEGEVEGTGERWSPQKDLYIENACLPLQIKEIETVLESQLRTFTRLGSDQKFHTTTEYPKFAWYEAIINACVHRSYSLKNMNIFVKMFDDRIEIESPGGFPASVTSENIYTMHHPRNPILFDALQLLGYVRGAREGTRRMREQMELMELPSPEFVQRSEIGASVVVTLRNNSKQRKVWLDTDAIAVVGEVLYRTLTQEEIRAINFIAEHGSISVSDLQRMTSKTWHSAKKILLRLTERGILDYKHRSSLDRDPQARFYLAGRGD